MESGWGTLAMQTGESSKLCPGRLGQGVPSWCADPTPEPALEAEDEEPPPHPRGLLLAAVNLRSSSETFLKRQLLNEGFIELIFKINSNKDIFFQILLVFED